MLCLQEGFFGPLAGAPGPWYTPFTDVELKYKTLTGRRVFYVHDLHQQYGQIVRVSPTEAVVSDLDAFREIHRIGSGFIKSDWYKTATSGIEDNLFVMTRVQNHAARRRLMARPFSRSSLLSSFQALVTDQALLAMSKISADVSKGNCDVMKWWTLMTSDVISHVAVGDVPCLLEAGEVSCISL
jgi:cytochrome P450